MRAKHSIAAACAALLWLAAQAASGQHGPSAFSNPAGVSGRSVTAVAASPYQAPSPYAAWRGVPASPTAVPDSGTRPFRVRVTAAETPANIPLVVPEPNSASDQDKPWDAFEMDKAESKDEGYCPTYDCRVFAEFLYLRPRNAEVAYAVESNLNLPVQQLPPVQTSRIGLVDPDYSSGFRFGFGFCLDECSELVVTYSLFESDTSNRIARDPTNNLRAIAPMTIHPATANAITPSVEAAADYGVDFDLVDIDFRRALLRTARSDVFGVVGIRYGQLEQGLFARYADDLTQAVNKAEVRTDIDFEGIGLKLGLEYEQYSNRRPVLVYLKGFASLLAGEFDATYQQTVQNNSNLGVNTDWTAGRIVPTFDLELGAGYYSPEGRLRATVGYAYSVWTNVVKTQDWIHGVQTNDFRGMEDSITFDGLVLRVEGRF